MKTINKIGYIVLRDDYEKLTLLVDDTGNEYHEWCQIQHYKDVGQEKEIIVHLGKYIFRILKG